MYKKLISIFKKTSSIYLIHKIRSIHISRIASMTTRLKATRSSFYSYIKSL
jgi:hypothetical protein